MKKYFQLFSILGLIVIVLSLEKPLCQHNEYLVGNWVYFPSQIKSFVCCGSDWINIPEVPDFQIPLLKDTCFQDTNRFDSDNFTAVTTNLYLTSGGHACFCDSTLTDRNLVSDREKWIWEPLTCSMLEWDTQNFCEMLGTRKILMIGDSTMQQTAITLANMLISGINKKKIRDSCVSQVSFYRENKLTISTVMEAVQIYQPDILILNAGPHHHQFEKFRDSMIELFLELRKLKQSNHLLFRNLTFLWKTINPAHQNCQNIQSPLTQKQSIDPLQDIYHWREFEKFDRFISTFQQNITLENKQLPTHHPSLLSPPSSIIASPLTTKNPTLTPLFSILDLSPLYLRADAHPHMILRPAWPQGDCLHYCLPGPLDLFSIVLLHWLKENHKS